MRVRVRVRVHNNIMRVSVHVRVHVCVAYLSCRSRGVETLAARCSRECGARWTDLNPASDYGWASKTWGSRDTGKVKVMSPPWVK